jgi:hypothetical protein
MCSKVICRQCGKPTWSGCGQHIEEALVNIPEAQRCQGHQDDAPKTKKSLFKIFGK